jgi:hypothetical protein
MDERISYFAAGDFQGARKGGARNGHSFSSDFLIQTVEVSQTQSFQLVQTQDGFFKVGAGHSHGLEKIHMGHKLNRAGL